MLADPIYWGSVLCALAGGVLLGSAWHRSAVKAARRAWPQRWNLNARPLFSSHERALYRELKAALPHHVVLAKVSLLRFCLSADASDARAWYERLQALHVSLLVCTPHGAVISAIDIENSPGKAAKRAQRLKEAVLDACRVRYLRCLPGQWPQAGLLAAWALGQTVSGELDAAPGAHGSLHDAGDQLARKLRQRRAERAARWAESSFSQDSFFAFDSRLDSAANSGPIPLAPALEDEAALPPSLSDTRSLSTG
jgi:hypothetical protein